MTAVPLVPDPLVLTLCGRCRRVRRDCQPTDHGLRCPDCARVER